MTSTNQIYVDNNTELSLTEKLYELDGRMVAIEENDALRGLNVSRELEFNNGTFSLAINDINFEQSKVYLVSIKYAKANGLVDQSLYTLNYFPGVRLQPTYNVVKCYNGNDNFLATLSGSTLTIATSYTGSDVPTTATVRFI